MLAPCRLGGGSFPSGTERPDACQKLEAFVSVALFSRLERSEFQLSLNLTGTYFLSDKRLIVSHPPELTLILRTFIATSCAHSCGLDVLTWLGG